MQERDKQISEAGKRGHRRPGYQGDPDHRSPASLGVGRDGLPHRSPRPDRPCRPGANLRYLSRGSEPNGCDSAGMRT